MKKADIKGLSESELQARLTEERNNLQRLKFAHAVTPLENPSKIKEGRKLVARLLTQIRAQELANVKK
jgi:large subunit ribosomal protein L29